MTEGGGRRAREGARGRERCSAEGAGMDREAAAEWRGVARVALPFAFYTISHRNTGSAQTLP